MKVAYLYNYDFPVWRFRRGLIETLMRCGHEVSVICPEGDYTEQIKQLGVNYIPIQIDRFINPFGDLKFLYTLYNILRRERFDLVHNFTIKPNTYGALAARMAGVQKRVSLVPGIGYAFADSSGFKASMLSKIAKLFYRIGFKCTDKVWFQNPDDLQFFVQERLILPNKCVLIRGSGVNTEEFSMKAVAQESIDGLRTEFGVPEFTHVVVMPARATRSKGVPEFIEASRIVALQYPEIRFILIGLPADGDPGSLSVNYLRSNEGKNFKWLGFRQDAREVLALADVVALPSYYREGIPRSLLEALALAKPVVTTDSVGCRETVESGRNGFLVPIKNAEALANAIITLLRDDDMRRCFGCYSREKAKKEFSERSVIEHVFRNLYGFSSSSELNLI